MHKTDSVKGREQEPDKSTKSSSNRKTSINIHFILTFHLKTISTNAFTVHHKTRIFFLFISFSLYALLLVRSIVSFRFRFFFLFSYLFSLKEHRKCSFRKRLNCARVRELDFYYVKLCYIQYTSESIILAGTGRAQLLPKK